MQLIKTIIKKIKRDSFSSFLCKYTAYAFLRLLFFTYRLEIKKINRILSASSLPIGVYYFWHQQIIGGMFFFYNLKASGACVVSPSNDGQIAGYVCKKLGFDVLYGSSNKSPVTLIRQSLDTLMKTGKLCLVGDGSRGPAFQLQKGVRYLADKANVPLVYVECKPQWAITFKRSWDQFQLPLPFSKITVTIHTPIEIPTRHKDIEKDVCSCCIA